MPFTWRISIKPLANPTPSARASFDPVQQPQQIQVGDQIVWTNDDSQPHFPTPDPVQGQPAYAFMSNQIAGNSASSGYAPANPGTVNYHCSLHPGETGSFVVS